MFADSHATIILMNNFITPQVTNMANMFKKSMIPDLDLSSFATSKKANITGMFEGMAYEDYKVTNNYKKIYTSSEEQSEKFRQSHVKSNGLKFLLKPAEE